MEDNAAVLTNSERLTESRALELAKALAALNHYPYEPAARARIADILISMCGDSEARAVWIVDKMLELYDEWPGPRTFRAVFCQRYKPADGIEANVAGGEV